jgi:RHS repeat-associated protein
MAQTGITMDKSGFFYAYVVNESSMNVYFDDFQVSTTSGQVLEQNDYYPFGLLNAQLSAPGITNPINKYKYNGKELQNELNLAWLDYGARFYDPQIGRWHSIDPLAENFGSLNPYNYCKNDPIVFIDPTGMSSHYNWDYYNNQTGVKGRYEDEGGNEVSWNQIENEFNLGSSNQLNEEENYGDPPTKTKNNNSKNSSQTGSKAKSGKQQKISAKSGWGGNGIANAANIVGSFESPFNLMTDNISNASNGIRVTGTGLSILSTGLTGYQVYNQFKEGGMRNINSADATSVGAGITGLIAKVMERVGFCGQAASFIGDAAGIAGLGITTFQLWNNVYKPMNDLRYAPSSIDPNGEPVYGDPYHADDNW